MSIDISLVVPTYNRADYLKKSLDTFVNQSIDMHSYEIVVVDNNSNDSTFEVFKFYSDKYNHHNWAYYFEPRQGLHYARNRGILSARGRIIVFGDDDIDASPRWLESVLDSFDKDADIGIVGGPIYPIWDGDPPKWIYDFGTKDQHGVFAYLNYGDSSKYLENQDLYGCNFAIKKSVAMEIHGSGPDTFPRNMIHFSGSGEVAMLLRARGKGYKVYYDVRATVSHYAPISRCTLSYFITRHQRWAVESIYHQYNTGSRLPLIFMRLILRSFRFLKMMTKILVMGGVTNKRYFVVIKTSQLVFSWKHFFKLIFNSDLRAYTRKQDYLVE